MKRISPKLVSLMLLLTISAQPLHGDSSSRAVSAVHNSAAYLAKGVINGRYRKPAWREYFTYDRIELPDIHLRELPPHPRLVTQADLDRARARLLLSPYSEWYNLLRSRINANRKYSGFVRDMAEDAKAIAFVAEMEGDPVLRGHAVELLRHIPEPPSLKKLLSSDSDKGWGEHLECAEAVISLCAAYDLLYGHMSDADREQFARKILRVTDLLVHCLNLTSRNNHITVVSSAVCTAALTFDESEGLVFSRRDDLLNTGLDYLTLSLGLIAPDGGYAEGPYYARFILSHLAPLSVYLMNTSGYRLFEQHRLDRMVNWVLDNHKGRGQFTAFDDSYDQDFVFLPVIMPQSRSGREWQRFMSARPAYGSFSVNLVEAITQYETTRVSPPPAVFFPGRFYPDMGQVIFRDCWPDPGFFASFLYEQERYFADIHEHIDPLAFELALNGEAFITDGGYGGGCGDPERSYFISPRANSTILVDGLGTDPNPHIGDELEGHLMFGFSTPSFAAAGISHRISDVDISRRVFFSKSGILLMLDTMHGASTHDYTLQYSTPGSFQDRGDGHIRYSLGSENLESFLLFDRIDQWRYDRNGGRITLDGKVTDCAVLGATTENTSDASAASIWIDGDAGRGLDVRALPLVKGSGQYRRLYDAGTGLTTDIMKAASDTCGTALMQSDGSLVVVSYRSPDDPESFLAVDAAWFRQGMLSMRSSRPVTCYLERNGLSWRGYISFDPEGGPVELTVGGIDVRQVVTDEGPRECVVKDGDMSFSLSMPGRIAFGAALSGIDVPQAHFAERDSLRSIMARLENRPHGAYAADYDTEIARDQASITLLRAVDSALEDAGENWFGDPAAIRNAADTMQGLIEYTFHRSRNNDGVVLPHRYRLADKTGPVDWELREEGTWQSFTPKVQDVAFRGTSEGDAEFRYRYERPFSQEERQRMSFRWQDTVGFGAGFRHGHDVDMVDWNMFYQGEDFSVRPDIVMTDEKLSAFRLDTQTGGINSSFSGDEDGNGDFMYAQTLNGRIHDINWRFDGTQMEGDDRERYHTGIAGHAGSGTFYAGGFGVERDGGKDAREGYLNLSGRLGRVMHMQAVDYHDEDLFIASSASWTGFHGRWSGNLRLKNRLIARENEVMLQYHSQLPGSIRFMSRMEYRYSPDIDAFMVSLLHRYSVPVAGSAFLNLLHSSRIGKVTSAESVGGGIFLLRPLPLHIELVHYPGMEPETNSVGWYTVLPVRPGNPLVISGQAACTDGTADMLELRLYEQSGNRYRKGLYYRKLPPRERILECFLEWQF